MKYREKIAAPIVEAITFDELVAHGRSTGAACHGEKQMPWSFYYHDVHVTHENDDRYIVNTEPFDRGDYLVTPEKGVPTVWTAEEFETTYGPAEDQEMTCQEKIGATDELGGLQQRLRLAESKNVGLNGALHALTARNADLERENAELKAQLDPLIQMVDDTAPPSPTEVQRVVTWMQDVSKHLYPEEQ